MEGHSMTMRESAALEQNTSTPAAQRRPGMRYKLKQIYCRPWTLSYLSVKLIERHYENNYGGALRRLNAITEELESLDFEKTPAHVLNGLKREQLLALNSTLLHELYFASMGGDGQPTKAMTETPARDFRSLGRLRAEGVGARRRLGVGAPDVRAARRASHQPVRRRPRAGGRKRRADPRPRHVRACVPPRFRCQRQGIRRYVPAQRGLAGAGAALRG